MTRSPVMLVEDDESLRESILGLLEDDGYQVYQAENGDVALNLLRSLPQDRLPGCILLDMAMPVMGGREFLKVLRQESPPPLSTLSICVMSAKNNLEEALSGLAEDVRLLKKPMDVDDLLNVVNEMCEH